MLHLACSLWVLTLQKEALNPISKLLLHSNHHLGGPWEESMGPEKILPRCCPDYCPYFWAALHPYCPAPCSSELSSQHLFLVSSGWKSWHLLLTLRWLSSPSSMQSSSFLFPLVQKSTEREQLLLPGLQQQQSPALMMHESPVHAGWFQSPVPAERLHSTLCSFYV